MPRYYAGVGTRELLPRHEQYKREQIDIARRAALAGLDLKSGGADFSDNNHLLGAHLGGRGKTAIIVRSKEFPHFHKPIREIPTILLMEEEDYQKAVEYFYRHGIFKQKHFESMGAFARNAHARNFFQIMNPQGTEPDVEFVSYLAREDRWGNVSGGTRTAVAVARQEGVPNFNIRFTSQLSELQKLVSSL